MRLFPSGLVVIDDIFISSGWRIVLLSLYFLADLPVW